MRLRISLLLALAVASVALLLSPAQLAKAQEPAVRAVLFYSPTCPHCEQVINRTLPAVFQAYGGTPRVWSISSRSGEEPVAYFVSNGKLQILLIDASWPAGQQLYGESIREHQLPADRRGVPQLVIRDSVLVGSDEIPSLLPSLVERGLAVGGEPWPSIDGLQELLAVAERASGGPVLSEAPRDSVAEESGATAEEERVVAGGAEGGSAAQGAAAGEAEGGPVQGEPSAAEPADIPQRGADATPPADERSAADEPGVPEVSARPNSAEPAGLETIDLGSSTPAQRFGRDPLGNGLSVAVLAAMVATLVVVWGRRHTAEPGRSASLAIPILCVVGLFVAGYLSWVEVRGASATCGPVGDCNAVQQSEYAQLFGLLPVGVLGLLGYAAILSAWVVARIASARNASGRVASLANVGLLALILAGTLFSAYLTFLEPFVIGATCLWCLASAIILTLLLWLSARAGLAAWRDLRRA